MIVRPLALAALLLSAAAPALRAQDVREAGRAHGTVPAAPTAPAVQAQLRGDSAFEFRRAWRQKTGRARAARAALERREGPRLSVSQIAAAEAAVTGTLRVPVLMGLYAGATAPYAQAEYQSRLFGDQLYSAKTLYREMSRGAFTLDGTVTPWLQLPQTAASYQPTARDDFAGTALFLQHSLQAADGAMDFGQFDNDGPDDIPNSGDDDGYVDAAAFVYPSAGKACGGPGIWPHRWVYSAWWGTPFRTSDASARGGVIQVDDYLIQGGIECDGRSLMQIGTFSHEMGHALGIPDLYDTDGADGGSAGLGEWDLMAGGSYRLPDAPVHMSAWTKDFLGWVNVETVASTRTAYSLPQVYTGGTVLRYDIPGTREYFLMEHRGAVGSDRNIHGAGLLVYHVDPVVIEQYEPYNEVNAHPRMGVALEEADGRGDLLVELNRGDGGDVFPGTTGRTVFGDAGTPSSRSNDGAPSGLELRGITRSGSTLTFDLVRGAVISVPAQVTMRAPVNGTATASFPVTLAGGPAAAFTASRRGAWLAVSPESGTTPATLTLTARAQGLAPGIYRDTVVVTSAGAVNSPAKVAVELTVQAGALALGDSVAGRLATTARRDTVSLQLTAGDVVDLAVFQAAAGSSFTPTLTLLSPTGSSSTTAWLTTGGAGVRRGRVWPGRSVGTTGTWRIVVSSASGTGDYVLKVRRAGPVVRLTPTLPYIPVAENAATGSDTVWVYNAGTGSSDFAAGVVNAPWFSLSAAGGRLATAAGPAAPGTRTEGERLPARHPRAAPGSAAVPGLAAGDGDEPVRAPVPGAVPLVLTGTRGPRVTGDYAGYLVAELADGWAGPAVVEATMRVYDEEVELVTPGKLSSEPMAMAVAPEGDLGVALANGDIVRVNPRTGAVTPWARSPGAFTLYGMAFGPDSSAYVADFTGVVRITRGGVASMALTTTGMVWDVAVTPSGMLFVAADDGLWRVTPAGVSTRLTAELTYSVAYSAADGMIYAAMDEPFLRRVNPATGAVTTVPVSDQSVQQHLEVGAGGAFYGRTHYLEYPDLRRMSATGVLERGWWTPDPSGPGMALAPDGTLYGAAGNRIFRLKVEGNAPPHLAGDVTGDGAITAQDALGVLSAAVGKTLPAGWTALHGDANCDGAVTAQDALIILSHAVGRDVTQFCVGRSRP